MGGRDRENEMKINRREFLKRTAAAAGGVLLPGRHQIMGMTTSATSGPVLPRRRLGRTGRDISIIGMGGIVVKDLEPAHAERIVRDAVARGVNYFDVAPTYGDAELKLGPALVPYRKNVFLACKTTQRKRAEAEAELRHSLERLGTDHLDLYQLHALNDVEKDVKVALGKGGALEAFLAAREKGLIRHIGFSAHTPEAALAALREFDFDTIMFPINFCLHFRKKYEVAVLEEARNRGLGIIALKALARQKWQDREQRKSYPRCWYEPVTDREFGALALSWTLAQGITAALPPGDERLFRLALEVAGGCRPPDETGLARLQAGADGLEPIF